MTQQQVQFEIRKIYIKDASLESPLAPEVFLDNNSAPAISIDLTIAQQELSQENHYEVVLKVTAEAKSEKGETLFITEIAQAGVFAIAGIPEEEMQLALNIACPNVLLPFARESISDLVTKSGFPQLLIAPVNFEALYKKRVEAEAAEKKAH